MNLKLRLAHRGGCLPAGTLPGLLRLCLVLPVVLVLLLLPLPILVTRALRTVAPQQPRRFIPPPLSPSDAAALRSEPACGAPAPRRPACEAWCPTSPFAPFAAALSGSGRGCWEAGPGAAPSLNTSSAPPPRPVLLFTGVHGLADTLAGALSALLIASLAGAEFHMRFSDSPADPSFLWAYDPNCIDALGGSGGGRGWPPAAAAALAAGHATHLAFPSHRVPPAVLAAAAGGDVRELWGGRAVLHLQTHAGLARHLLSNPRYAPRLAALGLTRHTVLAEAYHFLLRPRAAGMARFSTEVEALTAGAGAVRIAIHVRTGASSDAAFAAAAPPPLPPALIVADYAPFFDCAAEAAYELMQWGGLRRATWLVLSDSPALRAGAAAIFPPGTLLTRTPGVSVRHSRTSDLEVRAAENVTCDSFLDAAMEHWLFGLADAHVVTSWSGYGRTGALLHVGVGARLRPLFQLPARGAAAANCGLAAALSVQAVLDMPPGI